METEKKETKGALIQRKVKGKTTSNFTIFKIILRSIVFTFLKHLEVYITKQKCRKLN